MINQILASAMVFGAMAHSSVNPQPEYQGLGLEYYGMFENDANYYTFQNFEIDAYGDTNYCNTYTFVVELNSSNLEDFQFGAYISEINYYRSPMDYNYFKSMVIDKTEFSTIAVDQNFQTGDSQTIELSYTFDNIITFNHYYCYFMVYWNSDDHPNNYIDMIDSVSTSFINTNDNYSQGYSNGLVDGRKQGYDNGYDAGQDMGETIGYTNGFTSGYDAGKADGFNQGVASVSSSASSISGLFGAVANVPITILNSLMGPTIFGIPIITILLSTLALLVVLWLIHKII